MFCLFLVNITGGHEKQVALDPPIRRI